VKNRVRINHSHCFYDIWYQISATSLRDGSAIDIILDDLDRNKIAQHQIKNFIWIFDLGPEGISSEDLEKVYQWFLLQGVQKKNFRVAFSAIEDVAKIDYPCVCLKDRLIYNGNWYQHLKNQNIRWSELEISYKLICLMRRPSMSRALLAKKLLAKFDDKSLLISLGTDGGYCDSFIQKLIHPRPFPIVIDAPIVDQYVQHKLGHELFYGCAANFIVETSDYTAENTWHSIFITEKTFKALAWHQFPLWYAAPGLVGEVRKLGFDVFDDLFDNHAYDEIQDSWVRMTQVVLLAQRFCNQGLVQLRQRHWNRLVKNAQRIEELHTTAISRHTEALERLIYGT